ncbi:hypothetical protein KFE25_006060 [Diacronema lutheri]|uniref:DUF6816 domain-containing protein n=1 Tax=Diacronema lutheri TaxID=2081491 RepID=A0A8J5XX78_DIALT|nr:hypothetical protein KFE25_006060 [Diacronema lutheri]
MVGVFFGGHAGPTCASGEVTRRAFATLPFTARLTLGERLSQRRPDLLVKPIFNSPPGETQYPAWLAGTWDATQVFDGFVFPSPTIPRDRIMREPTVPGLQRLSVVSVPDMGKATCRFSLRFSPAGGRCVEDKRFNLASAVDGSLEARVVQRVEYDAARNPNRCSIVFRPGKERNAERVELFFNSRESDDSRVADGIFVTSEHLRQVTFGGSAVEGVVRQVSGSYGFFSTFTRLADGNVRRNLLTAAYLEPTEQEALFFQAVDQPVLVFSHEALLVPAQSQTESTESGPRLLGGQA